MLSPKKGLSKAFEKAYAKQSATGVESDFITQTSGATAVLSEEQLIEANSAPAGLREAKLAALSQKNIQDRLAQKEFNAQRRVALATPQGAFEKAHKETLGDEGKFVDFKDKVQNLTESKARLGEVEGKFDDLIDRGPVAWIANLFSDKNVWGRTEKEEKELGSLKKSVDKTETALNKEIKPTIQKLNAQLKLDSAESQAQLKVLMPQAREAQKAATPAKPLSFGDFLSKLYSKETVKNIGDTFSNAGDMMFGGGNANDLDVGSQIAILNAAERKRGETLKLTQDFLDGKNNIWDGLLNSKKDLGTLGLYGMTEEYVYKLPIVNKLDRLTKELGDPEKAFDTLTFAEQQLIKANAVHDDLRQGEATRNMFKDAKWYKAADGTGTSLVFMEQMLATQGWGNAAAKAIFGTAGKSLVQGAVKDVLANTIKGSLKRKAGLFVVDQAAKLPGYMAGAAISPSAYTMASQNYIGGMEIIEDDKGEKRVLVRDGLYKKYERDFNYQKSLINQERKAIQNKKTLTDKDKEALDSLDEKETQLTEEFEPLRPKSWFESAAYGYTETLKENIIEGEVGAIGGRIAGRIGKGVAGTTLGKALTKPNLLTTKAYKGASSLLKEGADRLNNMALGKITSKAMFRTGASKIVDGIPGEMFEEVVSQATPSVGQNYTEQLKGLLDTSFYEDVASQTALMGGLFTTVGAGSRIANWKANGRVWDARKSIIKKYKQIDKAITDEDLAETLVMASAGTDFSIADYDAKVQSLRDKGNKKLADQLEQKKFVNMATTAIKTGTLEQFETTLDSVLKNTDSQFSAETLNNVQLAKEKISKIKETYDRYKDKSNVGAIVDLATKKIALKQGLDNINAELGSQKALANEELQTVAPVQMLKGTSLENLMNSDIDSILEYQPQTPEEGAILDKFVNELDKKGSPAIDGYIALLEAKEEKLYNQRKTMEAFNAEVDPKREATLQKKKGIKRAIAQQIQDSIDFAESNGISAPGLEIDSMGVASVKKDFIEHAFKNVIDTYGLDKKELDALKQEYLNKIEFEETIKRDSASDNINLLYDQANAIIKDKKAERAANQAKESEEEVLSLYDENKEIEEASEEEVALYEENIETVREILLAHPAALENENYDSNYVSNVEANLDNFVYTANKKGELERSDIKSVLPMLSDIQAEAIAQSINANLVTAGSNVTEENVDSVVESIATVAQKAQETQAQIESIVFPDTAAEDIPDDFVIAEEDTLAGFQLMPGQLPNVDNLSDQEVRLFKKAIGDFYQTLSGEIGRKPTFKEMVYHFIEFTDKVQAEKYFSAYRIGWEANNYAPTNYDEVYSEIFQPARNAALAAHSIIESIFSNRTSTTATTEELENQAEEQLVSIQSAQTTVTSFTEENVPILSDNENTISSPALRLGFNAIKYEEVKQADGTYVRRAILTDSLNEDTPLINYKPLLDPNKNNPGDKLNVGMAPEEVWGQAMINVGRDAENKPVLKSFAAIVEEKEKQNPDFRNSQEFKDMVPMFAFDNTGEALAYIHDASWYSIWNVKDPSNPNGTINPNSISLSHKEAIEEAKQAATDFREAIYSGKVSKVTIKEKAEGPFYSIANKTDEEGNKLPLYTIEEANPQAEFAIQGKQNILEQGVGNSFENANRVIINKKEIANARQGNTWHLRRIGTNDKGQETWRAFGVVRYPNEAELETVRWAWAAYSFFDYKETVQGNNKVQIIQEVRSKFLPKEYQISEEKAREIVKDIRSISGYNLMDYEDAMAFFNLFIQPKTGNTPANFGRTLYSSDISAFSQHTLRDGLESNPTIPMIVNGTVGSTNRKYTDYLKTTLKTDVKSFNIGTADKPNYITSVQPKIVFEYEKGQAETNPVIEVKQAKQVAETVVQEARSATTEAELLKIADDLQKELGFNFEDIQAMPVEMNGVDHLKNILNLTPGLNIDQEYQLMNYTVQYINTLIDTEYKGKVNKAALSKQLADSYGSIVGPSVVKVKGVLDQLVALQAVSPSKQTVAMINNYKNMLVSLNNLEKNWNVEAIKATLSISGLPYEGQLGFIEKALQEASETSDIQDYKETEEEMQEEEDLSLREKSYDDAASLTENFKVKTTFRQKRFMSGITRVDNEGKPVKGFLGLTQYLDYNEVYDGIYNLLGSGVYIESDYATMRAKLLQMKDSHPWVKELVEKYDNADEQLRKGLVLNYRKHAISMKFMMYTNNNRNNRLQVYDTNANEITRVIRNEWKNNFITSPLVMVDKGQYSINRDVASKLLEQYNSWGTEGHLQSDEVVRDWLSNFGLDFSDRYWQELKELGMMSKGKYIPYSDLFSSPNTPMGFLSIYLNRIVNPSNVDYIKDLRFEENEKAHPFKDMQGVLKDLSKGQSKFTDKILSKSFRDGQKNISGITNPTYITNRIDDLIRSGLSEDKAFIKELQSLSISSKSVMLELMDKYPDFAKKLELNHLGITALKEYGKKSGGFSSILDLNSIDHDLTKLGFFQDTQQGDVPSRIKIGGFKMRMARMFVPTMSDKSQMYTLNTAVFDFMKQSNSAFETDEEGNIVFSTELRELLYERLVLPEMTRISNFHKNVSTTQVKDYDKAAQIFNFIPALNNLKDEQGYRIIQHLAERPLDEVESLYKDSMMNVVENVMHTLAEEKMQALSSFLEKNDKGEVTAVNFFDSSYLSSNTSNLSLENKFAHATYDFVLNSVLTNADTFVTIAGDPAFFSQDKLFEKGVPSYAMSSDESYIQLAKKQGVNIGKRLAYLSAPGTTLADSKDAKYKQIFLQDAKDISENAEYLISLYAGKQTLQEPLFEGDTLSVEKALKEYKSATDLRKKVIRTGLQNKFPSIADYFDIDTTDAQEYTTAKEHVGILYNQERLPEQKYKDIIEKLDNGTDLTYEELGLVMQPIKPVYTGQIIDAAKDMSRPIYIKSSSFPLIPQLTAGLKLDNLRVALEKLESPVEKGGYGMPVRASYQSANKVGAVVDSNTIDPLNTESLKSIETAMVELNRNDFRIQQDVPFKSAMKKEDKIAMGTQIFKLLFGDGVLNIQGFQYKGATLSGVQLYDEYNKTFNALVESKKRDLYNELGLDENAVPVDETTTIKKIQNLLQKEAIGRNYPLKDIKGLELQTLYDNQGNPYYEFNVPLWLSTNSNRYESLLNAIINNRLITQKLPGNSFVAASENGFGFKENLEGIDKSRIIFMDNYNGVELQGVLAKEKDENGVRQFTKAQVFVPSKFKDASGKLIDLFAKKDGEHIYLTKRENGTWKLKEGMISPELLNQFSYRTPTSSHVSASTIEIAGILPPEVGDLMVVPKNFTKQKGLDFDVDKENVYQLNHITDYRTGKIEVLSESHKEKALKKLSMLLEELDLERVKLERRLLPEEAAKLLGEYGNKEKIDLEQYFGSDLLEEVLSEEKGLQEKYNSIEAKLNQKLLENDFISIHTSVFNNPSPKMQAKINKVLSMDFAREQADLIEEFVEVSKKKEIENRLMGEAMLSDIEAKGLSHQTSNAFTILSDQYQKQKMGLGSAGKMAIGVYSNYVTLHALIQQSRNPISLIQEYDEDGKPIIKNISIGNLNSKGLLGLTNTLDGSRSIAEAFAEKQNTATDNEKEQILGRVNINSTTIGVDSILTLLGFDKISYEGNKQLSVSYALLSQPIIKEYVDALQKSKGITANYNPNAEQDIIDGLVSKYSHSNINMDTANSKMLTGDALVEGIKTSGKNAEVQLAALKTFLDLDAYAKSMAKVNSVINLRNLGKSNIEANLKYKDLANLPYNTMFNNITSLIGDVIPVRDNIAKPEGYVVVGDFFIKPNTPQGSIVVNGLKASSTLWSDFFPYEDPYIQMIMESVFQTSNVPADSKYKQIEMYQDVFDEIKKYINSWSGFGLFNGTAETERQRLFIDSNTNTSLANYLNSNSKVPSLGRNRLLNRFSYEVETDGRPSLIKYNNTISDDLNEKYLYNAFAEMIINDRPLPDWNGKPFSTKALAQELITYAYVEGGVQEATQFIKYVPLEYLQEVGIKEKGQFVAASTLFQRMNTKRNPQLFKSFLGDVNTPLGKNLFVKQYFQHNPEKTTAVDPKRLDLKADKVQIDYLDTTPDFVHVRVKTKSKLKQDKFQLYQHLGQAQYARISVLGTSGMNEYKAGSTNVNSIISPKKFEESKIDNELVESGKSPVDDITEVLDNVSAQSVLTSIAKSSSQKLSRYKAIAEALVPFINSNTMIKKGDSISELGMSVGGAYKESKDFIFIDSVNAKKREGGEIGIFMHEVVHALTVKELKQYYSADEQGFFTVLSENAPAHVVELNKVWLEFVANVTPELLESTKNKLVQIKAGVNIGMTEDELNIGYAAMDIFEFMAIALESKKLQTYMSTIKYKGTTKSLLDKLLEAVQGILKAINPDIKSGTLAETALVNVLDFIKAEQEIKEQNAIFETADFDVSELENDLVERNLSEEQIYDGNVDLSEETPEDAEDTLMPVEDTTLPCEGGIAI